MTSCKNVQICEANICFEPKFIRIVLIINQDCKVRPEIINVKSNKPVFFPFIIKASKWSDNCNNINDPYAKLCVPDVVKN